GENPLTLDSIKRYIENKSVPERLVDKEAEVEVPIILGEVYKMEGLIVIDGYHRERASELTGKKQIKAKIYKFASMEDAREEAFRLNEAKGISLNEADIAYSLYNNFAARLRKDPTVKLNPYVTKHCSKPVSKSTRLVYFAFFKREILGEDFTEIENGHTIYEDLKSFLKLRGYGYIDIPFSFKEQMKDFIEELEYKKMFSLSVVRALRDLDKKKFSENENYDLVDLIDIYIKDMGTRTITKDEQELADDTEEMLRNRIEAEETLSGNEYADDIKTPNNYKATSTIKDECEDEEVVVKPQDKRYSSVDNEESINQASAYVVMVLTMAKADPSTITPIIKEKLEEMLLNIKEIISI
ncbi:MAG: hypothetical protein ACRC0G_09085, partial [Fusobacteriaceae bacterium]